MFKRRIVGVILAYFMLLFVFIAAYEEPKEEVVIEETEIKAGFIKFVEDIEIDTEEIELEKRAASRLEIINNYSADKEDIKTISKSDIDLLATIVRAEAGNQSLEGKRAVADVVLNRVDSDRFPNTIKDVIYQKGQFSCVVDGNFTKAMTTKDETDYEAVLLELEERTDSEIIFFQTSNYSSYGTPAYVIGDHYFAKQ